MIRYGRLSNNLDVYNYIIIISYIDSHTCIFIWLKCPIILTFNKLSIHHDG